MHRLSPQKLGYCAYVWPAFTVAGTWKSPIAKSCQSRFSLRRTELKCALVPSAGFEQVGCNTLHLQAGELGRIVGCREPHRRPCTARIGRLPKKQSRAAHLALRQVSLALGEEFVGALVLNGRWFRRRNFGRCRAHGLARYGGGGWRGCRWVWRLERRRRRNNERCARFGECAAVNAHQRDFELGSSRKSRRDINPEHGKGVQGHGPRARTDGVTVVDGDELRQPAHPDKAGDRQRLTRQ